MPIETRTLVFSTTELADAAYTYCLRKGVELPPARILSIEAVPEPQPAVMLRFAAIGLEAQRPVLLSYSQMAAALIIHCRDNGIPLPRAGQKRLTPAGDGMALIVRLPAGVAARAPDQTAGEAAA